MVRLRRDPLGELTALPRPPSWIKEWTPGKGEREGRKTRDDVREEWAVEGRKKKSGGERR